MLVFVGQGKESRMRKFTLSSSSHCPISILLGGFGGIVVVIGAGVVVLEKIFKSQRPLLTLFSVSGGESFEVSGEHNIATVMIST